MILELTLVIVIFLSFATSWDNAIKRLLANLSFVALMTTIGYYMGQGVHARGSEITMWIGFVYAIIWLEQNRRKYGESKKRLESNKINKGLQNRFRNDQEA